MNDKTLDQYLRKLSLREKELKEAKKENCSIEKLKNEGEKAAFDMDFSRFEKGKVHPNFVIFPHVRFVPVPMHSHNYVELFYMYSGSVRQTIQGKEILLTEGQIGLIDTGVSHSIGDTGENDIMINILMTKDFLTVPFLSRFSDSSVISGFFANAINTAASHNNYIIFCSENSRRIHLYFRELLCEYFNPGAGFRQILENLMALIFLELLNVYERDESVKTERSAALIFPVLRYIEANYVTCTLKSTASFFNLNPTYLSTLLKEHTGKTYRQIVTNEKLVHAAYLLQNTTLPVYEIANSIGYENLSFFFEKFQKEYGMTPKEYRDQQVSFGESRTIL